jgi:hypothetical protein
MITNPTTSLPNVHLNIPHLLRRAWQFSPIMTTFGFAMAGVSLAGLLGMLLDPRQIMGAPAWSKTTKFAMSFTLYAPTLLWMMSQVRRWPRAAAFVANASGAILFFEMALIIVQAVRGEAMHFNYSTPFNTLLWQTMTVTIMVLYAIQFLGAGLLLFTKLPSPALTWGLRLGLLVMLIGLAEGFLMPVPTASQLEELNAGRAVAYIGAHTVGAPDGGPGMPLTGWSTTNGDLRIGHFVGIHGLQVIPLLAILVSRRREPWLSEGHKVALVGVGTASYLGVTALVTWQALRGQPLLAPDSLTWGALAGLVAGTAVLFGAVLAQGRLLYRKAA